jgi:hypothetical protein
VTFYSKKRDEEIVGMAKLALIFEEDLPVKSNSTQKNGLQPRQEKPKLNNLG